MTRFRTYCSRAEQLSLAAMAQAPTPGVESSADFVAVPGVVSRDAAKLALLEELKENIARMERESAPTFGGPSQRNPDPEYPASKQSNATQHQTVTRRGVTCYPRARVPHVTLGRACHMLPRAKQSKGKQSRGKQSKAKQSKSKANQTVTPRVSHVTPGRACHMLP